MGFKEGSAYIWFGSENGSARDVPGKMEMKKREHSRQMSKGREEGSTAHICGLHKCHWAGASVCAKGVPKQEIIPKHQQTACSPEIVNTVSMGSHFLGKEQTVLC